MLLSRVGHGGHAAPFGLVVITFVLYFATHAHVAIADTPVIDRLSEPGVFTDVETETLVLDTSDRPESLVVTVTYPAAAGPHPVVVFSHGNFCDVTRYDKIVRHWVSHGYVVLQPWHLDTAPFDPEFPHSQHTVWITRMNDMRAVLDTLVFNDSSASALNQKFDTTKVIAAGHSYGALTAQSLVGARTKSRDGSASVIQTFDQRISAVIAISPPGQMEGFVDEATASDIRVPMLVTTGTKDFSAVMWPDWRAHRLTYDTAPKGDKSLLVLNGGDHYLGGLICLERDTPDQSQGLRLLNAVTTAFLNSHVLKTTEFQKASQELGNSDSDSWAAVLEMK